MDIFLVVCDLILISIANYFLFDSFFELKKEKNWIIYYIFYFLFVLPILLDRVYAISAHNLTFRYGYSIMTSDPVVGVVYDACISFICCILYYLLKHSFKNVHGIERASLLENKLIKSVLLFGSFLPIGLFVFGCFVSKRTPFLIFNFGWRYLYENSLPSGEIFAYSAAERLTYIGIVCSLLLLFGVKYKEIFARENNGFNIKKIAIFLVLSSLLVISILLNNLIEGKRSIFLFTGIVLSICLIYKIKWGKRGVILGIIFLFIIVALFIGVIYLGTNFRGKTGEGEGIKMYEYTLLRVDYFRDQSLKFVIYSLFHSKEIQLLSFPFQSYMTEIWYLFPLVYIPLSFKKGYETYFTASNSLIGSESLNPTRLTNSGLDEFCANFSFFGILIFCVLLYFLIKKTKTCSSDWKILLCVSFVLFMMYTTSYVCWFYEFVVAVFVLQKISVQKKKLLKEDGAKNA